MLITKIVSIKNVIRTDFFLHICGEIMINITKNTSMKNLYWPEYQITNRLFAKILMNIRVMILFFLIQV